MNELKTINADIAVLGGGGAGLVAAARAASLSPNLKIVVLEKAKYSGGGAKAAGDFRVYNSKWQKDRGLDDALDTDLLKVMDQTRWSLDNELVCRTFLATGEFFDWVCSLGDDIADRWEPGRYIFDYPDKGPVIPTYAGLPEERKPAAPMAPPPDSDGEELNNGAGPMMPQGMRSGTYIMKLMEEQCGKKNVPILLEHKVVDVEVGDGKITAIITESPDGAVKVNCKACILATGSWISNPEVLKKAAPAFATLDPDPAIPGGHRNSNYTGDGIAIAEKAGAFVDYESFCVRPMGPSPKGSGSSPMPKSQTVNAMSRHPYALQVNKLGRRYTCEPSTVRMELFESAHIALSQPEAKTYLVFDKNTVEQAILNFKPSSGGIFGAIPIPKDFEADIASDPGLFTGNTVEELAESMGVDKQGLADTISNYNKYCKQGFDRDCFKPASELVPLTSPFYAAECAVDTDGAFGGVLVNADIQAFAKDRKGTVEGLYVPGDFSSGRFVNDRGMKIQIINDLSWAFASGFIAAESAVDYLNKIN